jgi:molybdopterin-guanine dinucleotide biosynthesis protein A
MTSDAFIFSIALSAGGQSTRMGRDKGLLPFMGIPMYQYILDQVLPLSEDVFIITNNVADYSSYDGRVLPDKIPGIGALGGLHAALTYAQHDLCLVLACDMPFVNRNLVDYLLGASDGADVVIPELGPGLLEPFRAVYRKSCLAAVERAIQAGERRATGFLSMVNVYKLTRPTLEEIDPTLDTFLNINSPKDLAYVEGYAKQNEQKWKATQVKLKRL